MKQEKPEKQRGNWCTVMRRDKDTGKAEADIVRTAKILRLWVHVGRVNTPKRFDHFKNLGADSCDGSGVAMYDHMLEKIEHRAPDPRIPLFKTENCQAV